MNEANEGRWYKLLEGLPEHTMRCVFEGLIVLGNAGFVYEEHLVAQAEQRQQNEELKSICQTLDKLQDQLANQERILQEEQTRWKEEEKSYKEGLEKLQSKLEKKTLEFEAIQRDLEEKNRQLTEAEQRLINLEESHRENLDAIETQHQTELTKLREQHTSELDNLEKQHASERDRIRQEGKAAMEKAVEKYQEFHPELDLYDRYNMWIRKNCFRISLNSLDCDSFPAFIACCGQRWTLSYIFQELATLDLWTWEPQDVAILNEVIDCCCRLQNLQRVRPDGLYDPLLHYAQEGGPANGYITDVLLNGVAENGEMLEDCKPFVILG